MALPGERDRVTGVCVEPAAARAPLGLLGWLLGGSIQWGQPPTPLPSSFS